MCGELLNQAAERTKWVGIHSRAKESEKQPDLANSRWKEHPLQFTRTELGLKQSKKCRDLAASWESKYRWDGDSKNLTRNGVTAIVNWDLLERTNSALFEKHVRIGHKF
mgnify:CR=1 FL=1